MNILFVSEKFPYPLDTGGNVRTFHLLKGLARHHKVTLISCDAGEVDPAHAAEIARMCHEVRLVKVQPAGMVSTLLSFARSLLSEVPFVLSRHRYDAVRSELRAQLERSTQDGRSSFDLVHFNHLDAALYSDIIPRDVLRSVDQHNVVTNQVKTTLASEARIAHRLALQHEYRKLRRFEPKLCNVMDICLTCSDVDAQHLRALGVSTRISTIPNGVDLDYFKPRAENVASACEILFLGTMDYEPCETAVWYFCKEILPLIRREVPALRFVVVGRNPSARLRAFAAANDCVRLTGRVDDVRPHAYRARAFVVPILSGSGTRLKILEAMAMGIPVVSTTLGAEGIEAVHGEQLLFADSPGDFARRVLECIGNPESLVHMARNARTLVEQKYGWGAITTRLLQDYQALQAA